MKSHLKYLWYVLKHKAFVFRAGMLTGAPLWNLIIHDWSKFTPAEWKPYVDQFHGSCDVGHRKHEALCAFCGSRKDRFKRAWLHHIHANPHHWEGWVLDGLALEMPEAYVREMVADWCGAGRGITGKWEADVWYENNKHKMALHKKTRERVEILLNHAMEKLSADHGSYREYPSQRAR